MSKLLDAIRRVRPVGRGSQSAGDLTPIDVDGRRVLIVYLFRALGDAVLLAPAVKALVNAGAEVELLVQAGAARILKLVDLPVRLHTLTEVLDCPPQTSVEPEFAEAASKLEAKLAKRKFDVAIELTARADVDGRRWVVATDAEHRLGWTVDDETPEDIGLTSGTPDVRHRTDRHWSQFQILPMRRLGVKKPDYDVAFEIRPTAYERAAAILGAEPNVVIVPGAAQAHRRWKAEHFARIGRWVTEERGGSVIVVGAPDEAALVKTIVKSIGPGATKFTQKSLETLLALIDGADAVVTNDTGPMHFAFLLNVPTLAIFTWMSPVAWGPWRRDPRFVVMRTPNDAAVEDAEGIMARAGIHYLEGLLSCAR